MKTKRNIFIAFILNLFFSVFEVFGGIITGSIAITSDAIHDFGDATSIGLAYFLERRSDKNPNKKYSYGYVRFSLLGGLITTFILLISSGIVLYSAIIRIIIPVQINYDGMIIFAVIGVVVNSIATYFTHGGKNINQKAVNLHMLEDVFGWLIVLVGAVIIKFTSFYIIDPILSIILALVIVINSIKNLIEIFQIFLDKTPKNIEVDDLINHVHNIDGVLDTHHLHVWSLDGEINCGTIHVVVKEYDSDIKQKVKEELKEHGISHITIEMETNIEDCIEKECVIKRDNNIHLNHHHH